MNTAVQHIHPWWLVMASLGIALFPILASLLSSYLKVSIVFGMLKSGFGAQGVPSGLVVMALSTATTLFIMGPVIQRSLNAATNISPKVLERAPDRSLLRETDYVLEPWVGFMRAHAGVRELQSFTELRQESDPALAPVSESAPFSVLVPAYLMTELKQAFTMGFAILIPFLAIDLIVANVLTGLGMVMASPVMIALPLKVLFFVMADGWMLLTRALIHSYAAP